MPHIFEKRLGMIMVVTLMILPICVILGATMLRILVTEKYFLQNEGHLGQTFYMAESGLAIAYRSFLERSFLEDGISDVSAVQGYTHSKEAGDGPEVSGEVITTGHLIIPSAIGAVAPFRRLTSGKYAGWYEYAWAPGDNHESLTGTGLRERIRFRVAHVYGEGASNSRPSSWEIVSEASLGQITKTHKLTGKLEGLFEYALLGKGDVNEFIRGADQFIQGKVHANGNIFFRPESGRTLTIRTDALTATGKFVYGVDAAGRPSSGFTVKVSKSNESGALVTWTPGLGSDSSNWHSPNKASPNYSSRKSAALITKDRIIHVSKGFLLSTNVALNATPSEPEEYPGDDSYVNRSNSRGTADVIEVNAALIDGAHLFDEVENRMENPEGGMLIPSRSYTVPSTAVTSWDDFLENLGGVVVKKRGSIIHLDNATLPERLDIIDPPPGVMAWHRSWNRHYTAPVRDYGYDVLLKNDPPPFQPVTATRILWQAN